MNSTAGGASVIPSLTLDDLAASRAYMQKARSFLPLGVTSSKRAAQRPAPIVIDHARGSRMFDIDGNEYIDYQGGWGPLLLGHQAKPVADAVRAQLERGEMFGAPHVGELELAERIVRLVPSADMATFLSSGSEAVHIALAIARGATGRRRVLKFDGQYHGWIAPMQTNQPGYALDKSNPFATRPEVGWPVSDDIVVSPWNDIAAFEAVMGDVGDTLAAVIMEPIGLNWGSLMPVPGYLERVRELCDVHGVVLIFDEVISGFRLGPGGAQELVGVMPDLTTFAKAFGGGYPISAVAGRREIMAAASDGPIRTFGTYNGGAVAVAAANGNLGEIERRGPELYETLERMSGALAEGLSDSARRHSAPLRVNRVGSALSLTWGLDHDPVTYSDMAASNHTATELLEEQLAVRGVYIASGQKLFVSAAHSDDDIGATIERFDDALRYVNSAL